MVILAAVLIIGLVIWMSRVWVNGSGRSQNQDESLQTRPCSVLYSSNPTSFIFDPTTAGHTGANNSGSFPDSAPSSDNITGTHAVRRIPGMTTPAAIVRVQPIRPATTREAAPWISIAQTPAALIAAARTKPGLQLFRFFGSEFNQILINIR